jgi:hypothetical protein
MFRSKQQSRNTGKVDGGEGRGVPLGGHDERPPTGYRAENDETDLGWEEEEDAERRRDPLRKP